MLKHVTVAPLLMLSLYLQGETMEDIIAFCAARKKLWLAPLLLILYAIGVMLGALR